MKDYTVTEVREMLRQACQLAGSQQEWARQHKLSTAYVNDAIHGRITPGPSIARELGLKRIMVYRREGEL